MIPGETLVTEMWKDGDTRVVFRTKIKERGEICISNAAMDLWKELPKPKDRSKPAAASSSAGAGGGGAAAVPTSGDIFRAIGTFVAGNPATAEKVKTVFLFNLAWSIKAGRPSGPNPWRSTSLEWQTPDTPPKHGNWGKDLPVVYRWAYDYNVPGAPEDFVPQNVPPGDPRAGNAPAGRDHGVHH